MFQRIAKIQPIGTRCMFAVSPRCELFTTYSKRLNQSDTQSQSSQSTTQNDENEDTNEQHNDENEEEYDDGNVVEASVK